MNVNACTDRPDGELRVKLVEYDPKTGHGRTQIIELRQRRARYYVTVRYGQEGPAVKAGRVMGYVPSSY
jgi:hypothetical protein